ncbi:putative reverse transcriptase domain-containing protein [Tanacetum coccineum]
MRRDYLKKVIEILDLFYILDITIDQVMLRAFLMSLTGAASHWLRNKPTSSITIWDGLKTKFLNKYCLPARTAKKMEEINNFQQGPNEKLYQAWEQFKELLMKYPQHYLMEMQEVILFYNGLGIPTRKILDSRCVILSKTTTDAKKKKGSHNPNFGKLMELHISITQYPERKKTQEVSLYIALLIMFALIMPLIVKYPKGIAENVLVGLGKFTFPIDFIDLDMPEDIKVPLVGEEKIIFKSVKPASSLIRRVYMISLRERMELDLEARLMGETLVLNRSLDPFLEDYIELNDLNEPIELRRNQGDDLMPTIEEGEFHNSIMKDKMVYKGNNVVGAIMNVPIFVETFSVVSDFTVLENMDAYRDEGMGDVIISEPFLREVGIKAKRFEGII